MVGVVTYVKKCPAGDREVAASTPMHAQRGSDPLFLVSWIEQDIISKNYFE
jgi:hypothetical protein